MDFPLLFHLENYSSKEWTNKKLGLDRLEQATSLFDHPQKKILSIHVGGTNGKGSTAAFLESILTAAGYRVGLFTSPHLAHVNERFRIGSKSIDHEDLERLLQKLAAKNLLPFFQTQSKNQPSIDTLSFFEVCTLLAFLYFEETAVDLAIFEVGLGGRLDATNLITPLVSVITEIGLDHTEILGETIDAIAREKAGIFKPNVPVVCGASSKIAQKILSEEAHKKSAPFEIIDPILFKKNGSFDWKEWKGLNPGLLGEHQIRNAMTALHALKKLPARFQEKLSEEVIRKGLRKVYWPGRCEKIAQNPDILFDGAHNLQGAESLVDTLKKEFPGRKWKVLSGFVRGKDWTKMLSKFSEIASDLTLVTLQNPRGLSIEEMKAGLQDLDLFVPIDLLENESAAVVFEKIRNAMKPNQSLLVAGSLYLLGELRRARNSSKIAITSSSST